MLQWVNSSLEISHKRVEDLCSGESQMCKQRATTVCLVEQVVNMSTVSCRYGKEIGYIHSGGNMTVLGRIDIRFGFRRN